MSKSREEMDALTEKKASTEVTTAIGWKPFYAATQGAKLDQKTDLVSRAKAGGMALEDCRNKAFTKFDDVEGWANWKLGEATGVHAEVIIIRAWLVDLIDEQIAAGNEVDLDTLVNMLNGRTIRASQPACWCCAALMTAWGIQYDNVPGNKPKTGWRHPFCVRSVPNADIPDKASSIDAAWLDRAKDGDF